MAKSEVVFPANRQALYEKYRYSAAVRSDDLLFVSGQVGSREDGSPEPTLRPRSAWRSPTWKRPYLREAAGSRTSSI